MNELNTTETAEGLVGPQSSVNLMEKSQEAPKSFAVDVHDEDKTHVPSDIDVEEDTSFWKRPDVRMWLYILAGTIVIFAIVFAVLSRETSLFKGFAITQPTDVTQGEEENIFAGFNGRAAEESSNDDDNTDTSDQTPQESSTDEVILDNAPVVEVNTDDETDQTPVETNTEEQITDFDPVFDDGFEFVFDNPTINDTPGVIPNLVDPVDNFDFSDSLGSNTNANIMASSEVQGDTGPAVWLAMVPSMLYALGRKKK